MRSLLGVVDCNVRDLVHSGYSAIFQANSPFAGLLTTLLTLYVAFMGYRLITGRTQLRVTDFALNAVKLGGVLALATQWDTYQTLVYGFLFQGPQQLATAMLAAIQP
ncbi:type IV secretion system protein, partial [Mycobacterium tuberculosis]